MELNRMLDNATVVLVVEDDPLIRDYEVAVLKAAGYQVLSAETGIEGAATFSRHFQEIDALVTDISLPGMDGLELAGFVRRVRHDQKILFASGSINVECRESIKEIPGAVFLAKPFTAQELLELLEELLRSGKSQTQGAVTVVRLGMGEFS